MKNLIIGAHGMIGTALSRQIPNAIKTVRLEPVPTKFETYADITKYETLFSIFSNYRPDIVYFTAANTNVDKCENLDTNITNIRGPTTVLRLCEQFESKLIFFSSSYVFDGKKKSPYDIADETNPISNYGRQKDVVENLILTSDAKFVIIRTVGVFGLDPLRKNFVNRVSDSAISGKKVYVPNDQYMNPILSTDLARTAIRLAKEHQGVFHVAGNRCVTKLEWAKEVAKYFGYEKNIVGISTKEMKQPAPRPKMGCLDCHELEVIGIKIPDFDAGLNLFLDSEVSL